MAMVHFTKGKSEHGVGTVSLLDDSYFHTWPGAVGSDRKWWK